jgi:hypothetical protein
MIVQEQIQQLRDDIETLRQGLEAFKRHKMHSAECYLDSALGSLEDELAALVARAAVEADPWKVAKQIIAAYEMEMPQVSNNVFQMICYIRHLNAEIERLNEELANRPIVYYATHKKDMYFASRYNTPTEPMLYTKKETEFLKNTDSYHIYDFVPYKGDKQ